MSENDQSKLNPSSEKSPSKTERRLDFLFDLIDSWAGHGRATPKPASGSNTNAQQLGKGSNSSSNLTREGPAEEPNLRDTAQEEVEQPEQQADTGGGMMSMALDFDGDGDVDLEDLALAATADVEGEALDTMEQLTIYKPIFVVVQSFVCLALWIYGSIASVLEAGESFDSVVNSMGGLETLIPGSTMVLVHGSDCEDYRWDVWRWIVYQWTHGNFSHVGMNIMLLLVAGIPLEGFHGHVRIAIVFNVSVIGGALTHMISKTHGMGLVGMSAGCYSLMAMHMADLIMNWHQNRWRKIKLLGLLLLIGLDVTVAQLSAPDDPTGHSAHLGGYVAGLIFGIFLVRNVKVKTCERVLQAAVLFIALGLIVFCFVWIAQWAPMSVWDSKPFCGSMVVYQIGFENWKCVTCTESHCGGQYDKEYYTEYSVPYEACLGNKYEFLN
eukprot:TRINITY_DN12274_c0_g1_i6.p1 TRINITY_DN12274_c0_g1~~TRINITY_DN12274_c0_g1_i6.p1  ORF type:complete len:439 (-),score=58.54 TRINITY_DN12274_c0_g1_i6:151-1467(-)